MQIVLLVIALFAGSAKSVSVCGTNAGAVARHSAGASRAAIIGYLIGLYLGSLALATIVNALGLIVAHALPVSLETRRLLLMAAFLIVGSIEVVRGDSVLPHITWAVPRTWAAAIRPGPFLFVFGLIRGVAILNHSPFASMHLWLLTVFLLPELVRTEQIALLFALGLAVWTVAYGCESLVRPVRRNSFFDRIALASLGRPRLIGRLDGTALLLMGTFLLAAP